MTERIVRFGFDDNLLGVLTEPPIGPADPDVPAVLWLNAGTLHHIHADPHDIARLMGVRTDGVSRRRR